MNVSSRELRLVLAAVVVLVAAFTWVVVKKQLVALQDVETRLSQLQLEENRGELILMKEGDLVRQLAEIKQQLPRHPQGKDVTTELSTQVQSMAGQAGLELTGFNPEEEEHLADIGLYQMSIRCKWQGSPQALISFLYQLQALGPVMDVEELKIKTSKTKPGQWATGSFIVDCVYSRYDAETGRARFNPEPTAEDAGPSTNRSTVATPSGDQS